MLQVIISLLTMLAISLAGHITPYDLELDFNNQGLASEFKLYFSLENGLAVNNYGRFVWPYDLGFTNTWTEHGTWGLVSAKCADPDIIYAVEIRRSDVPAEVADFVYYVRFTDDEPGTFRALDPDQIYMLKFTALATPATNGILGPIQLSTVSGGGEVGDTDYITYDLNPIFQYLEITPAPPASLIASFSSSSTYQNDIARSNYAVQLDVESTIDIENSFRIEFEMIGTEFTWVEDTCFDDSDSGAGITSVPDATYTYSSSKIFVNVLLPLEAGTKLRFSCGVRNPKYQTTGGINFKTMWYDSPQVVEQASVVAGLSTTTWNWGPTGTEYLKIYLGWGFDITDATDYQDAFRIYKNFDANFNTYNQIKFGFSPEDSTPTGMELELQLKTMNDPDFIIVPSTLANNLPNAVDTTATCIIDGSNTIICTGVGPMSDTIEYFISFKFYILSTGPATLPADFGEIRADDTLGNQVVEPLFATLVDSNIYQNKELFYANIDVPGDVDFRANNLVHSYAAGTAAVPSNAEYGLTQLLDTSELLDVYFQHYWATADIAAGAAGAGDGIEYFTTPAVSTSQDAINDITQCTGEGGVTFAVCEVHTVGSIVTSPGRYYTRFRVAPSANWNTQFPDAVSTLMVENIYINKASSLSIPDQGIFDWYGRTIEDQVTVANIGVDVLGASRVTFLINSYVVNEDALYNLHVGISNYWTSAGSNLDGTTFPAFIRVVGYFSTTEKANAQRLAVFFNGLEFFPEPDGTVACKSQVKELDCYGFQGLDDQIGFNPLVMSRVVIDISLLRRGDSAVNQINLIIPVKTITNFDQITMGLATLSESTLYYTDKQFYDTNVLKMIPLKDWSGLVNNAADITLNEDNSFQIDIPPGSQIGRTADVDFILIQPATDLFQNEDITNVANLPHPDVWAAMTYCATWPWNDDEEFQMTPISPDPLGSDALYFCIHTSYLDAGSTRHYCTYCPIEDDLDTTAEPNRESTNFQLPYQQGQDIPGGYQTFSTLDGALVLYGVDNRAGVLNIPQSLTTLELTPTPSILYKGFNNYQLVMSFTSTLIVPKDGIIEVTPSGASFGWDYIATAVGYFDGDPCTLSAFAGAGFTCTLSSTLDYEVGSHNLTIKGCDMDAGGITSYGFNIEVQTSGGDTVETNSVGQAGAYNIIVAAPGYEMTLRSLSFDIMNRQSTSWVRFEFSPEKIPTFANERYIFDLGNDFKAAQAGRALQCRVLIGDSYFFGFKQCDINDLNALTLVPFEEFWKDEDINDGFLTVELSNVLIPNTIATVLDGILETDLASQVQAAAATETFETPTAASTIGGGDLDIDKLTAQEGSISEIEFTYAPGETITNAHKIYILFPEYYSPGLGNQNMYCTIDDDPVHCEVYLSYTLKLEYFIQEYDTSDHTIKIIGVVEPPILAAGDIYFALDDDDDFKEIVEHTTITDVSPAQPALDSIIIYNVTLATTEIRLDTDYTITIMPSASVAASKYITVDFPDEYGTFLEVLQYQPTCVVTTDGGSSKASSCEFFGPRITIDLDGSLNANDLYHITLSGVRTPDQNLCKQNRFVIQVTSSDKSQVEYRSFASNANCAPVTYTLNDDLRKLEFTQSESEVTLDNPIVIERGALSSDICVTPDGEKFDKNFTMELDPVETTLFKLYPSSFEVTSGYTAICFQLGTFQETPATYYDVKFTKTEDLPLNYTAIPRLYVLIIDEIITFGPRLTNYDVAVGGISLPIFFDLSERPPASNITVTATLASGTSLVFADEASFVINEEVNYGYFLFKTTDGSAVGDTDTITLELTGTDAASYVLNTTSVTLTVIAAPEEDDEFLLTASITNNKKAIYQEFSVTLNQPGVVYWGIAMKNTFERPCDYLEDMALTFAKYNNLDHAQEQFGFFVLPSSQLTQVFQINNLRSAQSYKAIFCAENLARESAEQVEIDFSAADNNIKILEAEFTFNKTLTEWEEIQLACFFAREFQLLEYNVISEVSKLTCADRKDQIDLPSIYVPPIEPYLPAAVATYDLTHEGSRLLSMAHKDGYYCTNEFLYNPRNLQEEEEEDSEEEDGDEGGEEGFEGGEFEEEEEEDIIATYAFLFYGNFETESGDNFDLFIEDKMDALTSPSIASSLEFASQWKIFLTSINRYKNYQYAVYNNIIESITPGFTAFPAVEATMTPYSIALENVNLESDGWVYGIVQEITQEGVPNTVQIRNGLTADDSPSQSHVIQKVFQTETGVINFTGLSNFTEYNIYYYGTNEDLSRFAETTDIQVRQESTSAADPIITTHGKVLFTGVVMTAIVGVLTLLW